MKRTFPLLLVALSTACGDQTQELLVPEDLPRTQEAVSLALTPQAGPDDWIVVFRPGVADPPGLARRLVTEANGRLRFTYRNTIQGFAATIPAQALPGIRNNPNVVRVEPDGIATAVTVEDAGSWGLDRIDQRNLPLSGTYNYDTRGAGVNVYIIDTGIRTTHNEFGGRAFKSAKADFLGGTGDDCNGHGTHVAGTVGGTTYGVAKDVALYSVRVLDCGGSGFLSGVIAGIDWVTGQHMSTGGPSVANMSLSAPYPYALYPALNDAVAASVGAGVVHAVAAANDDADACGYIPASEPQALTVGATSSSDTRAGFSNYGGCVDLFAPGVAITSAVNTNDGATATWSGTSMASPHVAGVAALYLGLNRSADPATVASHILTNTTDGVVVDPGAGSPNKLLYSLITGDPPTETPTSPSNLTATAVSVSEIDLAWADNSDDEDNFQVERSDDNITFSLHATLGSDATTYSDAGLPPATTYSYRVLAGNAAGTSGPSNVVTATTDSDPSQPVEIIAKVGGVTITSVRKFQYAQVSADVTELDNESNKPMGVTVTGDWYWSTQTSPVRSSTGITEEGGQALLESGKIKVVSEATFVFCVTSLSGTGYVDLTEYPKCSHPGFIPGDPSVPGDPSGAPSNLTASWTTRAGGRAELAWTPGAGPEVDVYRWDKRIATTADNGRYNDRTGAPGNLYKVCIAGSDPTDSDKCSGTAIAAAFPLS